MNKKIIPFPKNNIIQLQNDLKKDGLDADIKVFYDKQDAVSFGILQLIFLQNQAFDEILHLILEKFENENVRNIVKTWQSRRNLIEDYMDEINACIEEDVDED
ncbi:hypothetical protein JK635_07765 [Neobacillus sp. YIM B02564]|uniref:Uncharacterized protein n=1 Tax=Neobacillus paridis TaxID=2803862 RepID=A0ABS1TPF0_9BACI|nr:hypothetical protein [Neobacillus paridis]MBL4952106.1 hypothetical protein [Neobacillus paridis]